ncbi:MAG TPA: hypothetical protein VMD25_07740, partial [Acidobacteriaceae bacterium]|nr:hypothetical protein [Acidobacteriaceae bacterium]
MTRVQARAGVSVFSRGGQPYCFLYCFLAAVRNTPLTGDVEPDLLKGTVSRLLRGHNLHPVDPRGSPALNSGQTTSHWR